MTDHGAYRHITVDQTGTIMVVTLATGHKANALCFDTMNEMVTLANSVAEDTSISAVVLTGQPIVFTGGMNLSDPNVVSPQELDLPERRRGAALGAKMCRAWESIEAVTIAAIEGPCVGGGVALALALDLRVCADNAVIYVPEVARGMNMSWQSVPRSVSLIGPARTKRMFLLAEQVSAQTAIDWGWADYPATSGSALESALGVAAQVEKMPSIATRMCKQSINVATNALHHAVSYMDADQLLLTQHSDDYIEGITSYLEKRDPEYKGK